MKFEGFLRIYNEDLDDGEDEDAKRLPAMAKGDKIGVKSIAANQHFTEPPPRYSEASLTKKLEELGIGRPSTYVSIMSTLRDRGYTRMDKKRLIPEDKGRIVIAFLESFFMRYVEYDFTADLEEQLDKVSAGDLKYKEVLRDFWLKFTASIGEVKDLRVSQVIDALNDLLAPHIFPAKADGGDARVCPSCGTGQVVIETVQVWHLRGLHQLSRVQVHPPDERADRRFLRDGTIRWHHAGNRPRYRCRRDAAHGPLRPLSAIG